MLSRRFASVVVLVIVVAFVVVAVAPAFAASPASLVLHSRLTSSAPKDGASVKTAREVVLTFNEDVNPSFVKVEVSGPDGDETDGDATTDGPTVTQPLVADLPAGEHTATYRVVSTDGHPVSGTVRFTTTAAPASASPSVTATATPSLTPTPSPTVSAVASPAPTVTTTPVSDDSGGTSPWLVVAVVGLLAVIGLAAWRTIGGRQADAQTDAEADAADVADDDAHRG
ncbi:MAG TPA: copper resistance protein CopC [Ornithinibacter sp.]|nr:copper resistance protein CopC [Ornithinibacter sp.]